MQKINKKKQFVSIRLSDNWWRQLTVKVSFHEAICQDTCRVAGHISDFTTHTRTCAGTHRQFVYSNRYSWLHIANPKTRFILLLSSYILTLSLFVFRSLSFSLLRYFSSFSYSFELRHASNSAALGDHLIGLAVKPAVIGKEYGKKKKRW